METDAYYKPDRPGCVTIYALLLWLGAAAYLLLAVLGGLGSLMEDPDLAVFGVMMAICLGLLALFPIVTGIGLWQMAKWGWWLVLIQQGLGIAGTLFYLVLALVGASAAEDSSFVTVLICTTLVGLGINGGIMYWFIDNRQLFDSAPRTEIGPYGEVVKVPAASSGVGTAVAIIAGGVAALCLLSITVIGVLTLLGPQIANVFSRITYGLE